MREEGVLSLEKGRQGWGWGENQCMRIYRAILMLSRDFLKNLAVFDLRVRCVVAEVPEDNLLAWENLARLRVFRPFLTRMRLGLGGR